MYEIWQDDELLETTDDVTVATRYYELGTNVTIVIIPNKTSPN